MFVQHEMAIEAEKAGRLAVFVINRSEKENYPLDLDLRGFADLGTAGTSARFRKITHYEMYSKDFEAKSSAGHDWKAPAINKNATLAKGLVTTKIKPLSWNVLILED